MILLEDLYGVSQEFGGRPLVNLTLRARERGINDPEVPEFVDGWASSRNKR